MGSCVGWRRERRAGWVQNRNVWQGWVAVGAGEWGVGGGRWGVGQKRNGWGTSVHNKQTSSEVPSLVEEIFMNSLSYHPRPLPHPHHHPPSSPAPTHG